MKNQGCHIVNALRRDGTGQRQRFPEALDNEYVQIDERSLETLLEFSRKFSEHIQYYTLTDAASGSWEAFFEKDITFVLARMMKAEIFRYREGLDAINGFNHYLQVVEEMVMRLADTDLGNNPTSSAVDNALLDLFNFIPTAVFGELKALPLLFDEWQADVIPELQLKAEISAMVRSELAPRLKKMIRFHHDVAQQRVGFPAVNPALFTGFGEEWGMTEFFQTNGEFDTFVVDYTNDPQPLAYKGEVEYEKILNTAQKLKQVFESFHNAALVLGKSAGKYVNQTLTDYPLHAPQSALFIAFLRIFEYAQSHLNQLTYRHLDFYYKEVLKLTEKAPTPDEVHVLFQLRKNIAGYLIPEGTLLDAGKDALGIQRYYETVRDIVLNQARIADLKTLYVDELVAQDGLANAAPSRGSVYAAQIPASADGLGAPLEGDEPAWHLFGESQVGLAESDRTLPDATLGFALSSPALYMREGDRRVMFIFTFEKGGFLSGFSRPELGLIEAEMKYSLMLQFSGEEEWVSQSPEKVMLINDHNTLVDHPDYFDVLTPYASTDDVMMLELKLSRDEPAVVGYNAKKLAGDFETDQPVLKFLFSNQGYALSSLVLAEFNLVDPYMVNDQVVFEGNGYTAVAQPQPGEYPGSGSAWLKWNSVEEAYAGNPVISGSPYEWFRHLEPQSLDLKVEVGRPFPTSPASDKGLTSLVLENDNGKLNPNKPFSLFGNQPTVGSKFYIGSEEAFSKKITEFKIGIKWIEVPGANLATWYNGYPSSMANSSFTVDLDLLDKGEWTSLGSRNLFNSGNAQVDQTQHADLSAIDFERDAEMETLNKFRASMARGFVRMELTGPGNGFGHVLYPKLLANAVVDLSRYEPVIQTNSNGQDVVTSSPPILPNAPFAPKIAELDLSYAATAVIDLSDSAETAYSSRIDRFFHLNPFGHVEVHPHTSPTGTVSLAPQFNNQGYLFVGLENCSPPEVITLFFQLAEGSGDPELARPEVEWSYLIQDQWIPLNPTEVLSDTTNGLLTSGVITLDLPREAEQASRILPGGLLWLRARVADNVAALNLAIMTSTQGVTAQFVDQGNDPNHLWNSLPAESITALQNSVFAVSEVTQPYASFGGKPGEQPRQFYTRVSERLRHKDRNINIWDYERIVLEEFPEIYKVKCLNHTSLDSEIEPGHVMIVPIPNLRNKNAVNPLEPKTSLNKLTEIHDFVSDAISPFVNLTVKNPLYEQVLVSFQVGYKTGYDAGFYTKQLNQEIIRFLSPWAFEEGEDIIFGGRIHSSLILNFIEERPYVDFVAKFQLDHVLEDGTVCADVKEAVASTSRSILVSASAHQVTHVRPEEVDCAIEGVVDGIGYMIMHDTFIVR